VNPTIKELERLVGFDTVSSRPVTPLVAYLEERLTRLGFRTETVGAREGKRSLIATAGPPTTEGLTISGHLDVVPVEGQPWTTDPFRLTERAGRLYGRGAADMKGFIAATLTALEALPIRELRQGLALVWTCDEEVGCHGSAEVAQWLSSAGRTLPTACLIGEPTGFAVMRMHAGHVQVTIDLQGEAAHSSAPELGVNAIEAAATLVLRLTALQRQLREEADPSLPMERPWVVLNVAMIHGGVAINLVPDHCRVEVGYRPLPGTSPDVVFRRIAALLPEGVEAHAHLGPVVPSLLTPDRTPLGELLAGFARPGPAAAAFATDGGNLARAGLAPLVFGPGQIEVAHKADEHIELGDLLRAVDVIGAIVHARCVST
jgi:acetylornithine deacetylase